jgi:hypothetical protein
MSGVPICQLGHPFDFLAGSEERRSVPGAGERMRPVLGDAGRDREPNRSSPAQHVSTPTEEAFDLENILLQAKISIRGGNAMFGSRKDENRCYTRFALNAPVTIWREGVTVAGHIVNISLGGALIRVDPAIPLHEAVTVSVHDSAKPAGLLNDLPATVIRTSETGCAVRFERMLLERGIGDAMNDQMSGLR